MWEDAPVSRYHSALWGLDGGTPEVAKAASMAWWSIGFAVDYNRVAELATASMLMYMVCVVTAWSPCPRSSQSGTGNG